VEAYALEAESREYDRTRPTAVNVRRWLH